MEYYLTIKINMQLLQAATVKNPEKTLEHIHMACENRLVCGDGVRARSSAVRRGEDGRGGWTGAHGAGPLTR